MFFTVTNASHLRTKMRRTVYEDSNPKVEQDREFLQLVKRGYSSELVQAVENRAWLGVTDYTKSTPLHIAAAQADFRSVQLFIQYRADVDALNNTKQTPLHKVAQISQQSLMKQAVEITRLLLRKGSRTDCVDAGGLLPLDYALKGFPEIVEILLDHVASIERTKQAELVPCTQENAQQIPYHEVSSDTNQLETFTEPRLIDRCSLDDPGKITYVLRLIREGHVSSARKFLLAMCVTEYMETSDLIHNAYEEIEKRVLVSLNMLAEVALAPHFGKATHIDRVCSLSEWHKFLVVIFIHEMRNKRLPVSCTQVEQMKKYVISFLVSHLEKVVGGIVQRLKNRGSFSATQNVNAFFDQVTSANDFKALIEEDLKICMDKQGSSVGKQGIFEKIGELEEVYNGLKRASSPELSPRLTRSTSPDVF